MSELKTLKDLRLPEEMKTENPLGYRALEKLIEDLKAEAVKWVKAYRTRITQGIAYDYTEAKLVWEAKIRWIMDFFNLTEEDFL